MAAATEDNFAEKIVTWLNAISMVKNKLFPTRFIYASIVFFGRKK
jgi:hypothetical protein